MRIHALSICSLLLAAAPLAAQLDHFVSSPPGFEGVEGSTNINLLGTEPLLRYQQIDSSAGLLEDRSIFAFRRDGFLPANPAYAERNVELELVYANSDRKNVSTYFVHNYKSDPQTVFTRKVVSFPSRIVNPALPPAAIDLSIPLDVAFTHDGERDLLWEVRVYSNDHAGTSYPFDADVGIPLENRQPGEEIGEGCIVTGGTVPMSLEADGINAGTSFGLGLRTEEALPNAMGAVLFSAGDSNFELPGLCTTLHTLEMLTSVAGSVDPSGLMDIEIRNLPYNAILIGESFVAQSAVLDAGVGPIGVALSNGSEITVPDDPSTTSQVVHLWALDPHATVATSGIQQGGILLFTSE